MELVPVPYVTENTRVNMILAVGEANKQEVLKFMENYMTVCMEKKDKTFLMLVRQLHMYEINLTCDREIIYVIHGVCLR